MSKIRSIHDRTFKKLMSDIRVARDFFSEHLPAEILAIAKLDTLQLSLGTFIDEDLKESMSDLLYKVDLNTGEFAYIYLLCEHKSKVDPVMPLTLLNYMVKIWALHLEQTSEKRLSLIFPKGEGNLLLCQLEDKFKTVPKQYREKIEEAKSDDLMKWGKRVLHKDTLEEVFLS